MRDYVIRRLLLMIPTMLLVTIIVFFFCQMLPGTAVEQILLQLEYRFEERDVAALKAALGVDVPVHVQYGRWFGGILRGDLGNSLWTGRPVLEDLLTKLPVSVELGAMSIIISLIITIPVGVYSAMRQDTTGDYIARSFAIFCIAVPGFWLGTMVMVYPSIWWQWTPPMEYVPFTENPIANLSMFIIPAIILGMVTSGTIMRMTRTMMLEVLRQDYIRTAWAKGLQERTVIYRHALKNALIPVVTIIGLHIPIVVGGAVVIEKIFVLPGIGRYLLEAIDRRDYIILSGINLLVAGVVLLTNLIVDITYAWLDPRVHYR